VEELDADLTFKCETRIECHCTACGAHWLCFKDEEEVVTLRFEDFGYNED
jgi:DNA-binding IclR family transcriptional regulator